MPQEPTPTGNWRQIARGYDELYKTLAEEFASRQDNHRCVAALTFSIQFSKIIPFATGKCGPQRGNQPERYLPRALGRNPTPACYAIWRLHSLQLGSARRDLQ